MKSKSKIPARFNWMLFAVLSALVDDTTRKQIEYLKAETQVLSTQLRKATGRKRIFLTDDQRRLLAVKAKAIGSKALAEVTDLFSPQTILGWYRKLVAKKYDGSSACKTGRKRTDIILVELALKLAKDNPDWGSLRIAHMMTYLGHKISGCTSGELCETTVLIPTASIKRSLRGTNSSSHTCM